MPYPIGIFYEHPQWFTPLFAELDRRGVAYDPIDAADPAFDPSRRLGPYGLVLNRMSPSAWTRGNGAAIGVAFAYMQRLEEQGTPVVNGAGAFAYETSKARQLELFSRLGVRFPRSVPVSDPSQLAPASDGLEFPVLIKPNLGGSGAGMRFFADRDQLEAAVAGMDLGGVEYLVNARDGHPYFYDVNALSNFVADAPDVIGFDPFVNLVDFLLDRASLEGAGAVAHP